MFCVVIDAFNAADNKNELMFKYNFINVRDDPTKCKGLLLFFDVLVGSVAGHRKWTSDMKKTQTITECNKVSISDEAFAELLILNYWDRWFEDKPARWTDSRVGNIEFKGWPSEAHQEFNTIYNRIKRQRENKASNDLVNSLFMQQYRQKYGNELKKRRHSYVEPELNVDACTDDW